ncbi:MAG: hypothetical protein GY796_00035 [Chloroflexi bacterium]|nr:hypothetical protein [Chloroflexota bacterium]
MNCTKVLRNAQMLRKYKDLSAVPFAAPVAALTRLHATQAAVAVRDGG